MTDPSTPVTTGPAHPSLIVFVAASFLAAVLPERGYLLYPVIPCQGIVLLYATRGIGKTFMALSMALSVAGGLALFGWRAPKGSKVLYVDGEMPAVAMQERLKNLALGLSVPGHALENLSILTPDLQNRSMPDLSTPAGQAMMEPLLFGVNLLILDNISSLCRSGKENEAQSWQAMQSWLLDLRRRGISVLLVHHAGKSGDQRGTSAREDVMDTIISLRRPRQYSMAEGARFEVHLTKARGFTGDEAKAFEVHLLDEDNILRWEVQDLEDVEMIQLKQLLSEGFSVRDCAEEMGLSKSKIHRMKRRLEEQG